MKEKFYAILAAFLGFTSTTVSAFQSNNLPLNSEIERIKEKLFKANENRSSILLPNYSTLKNKLFWLVAHGSHVSHKSHSSHSSHASHSSHTSGYTTPSNPYYYTPPAPTSPWYSATPYSPKRAITIQDLNVRKEANSDSDSIIILEKGTIISVIGYLNNWVKILYSNNSDDVIGWLNSDYIKSY